MKGGFRKRFNFFKFAEDEIDILLMGKIIKIKTKNGVDSKIEGIDRTIHSTDPAIIKI